MSETDGTPRPTLTRWFLFVDADGAPGLRTDASHAAKDSPVVYLASEVEALWQSTEAERISQTLTQAEAIDAKLRLKFGDIEKDNVELKAEIVALRAQLEELRRPVTMTLSTTAEGVSHTVSSSHHQPPLVNARDTIETLQAEIVALRAANSALEDSIEAFNRTDHDREGAATVWHDLFIEQKAISDALRAEVTSLSAQLKKERATGR
jgi:chromosome segregation ATPase